MRIQPYVSTELQFAYAYHIYFRWQTWRRRAINVLSEFDQVEFQSLADEFNIHVLEMKASSTDLACLLSLRPSDSVSVVASKLKGRLSKWIGQHRPVGPPMKSLKAGYFACSSGKSTAAQIEQYLETQGTHHGYERHARPPVYVMEWPIANESIDWLEATHSRSIVNFHGVLATTNRMGVFTATASEAVAARWRETERDLKYFLRKVSFLPDHVHLAVRVHASVVPAELLLSLMNVAQEVMFDSFSHLVIRAKVDRIWQPSAYLGSYGELASPMIQKYIRSWAESDD